MEEQSLFVASLWLCSVTSKCSCPANGVHYFMTGGRLSTAVGCSGGTISATLLAGQGGGGAYLTTPPGVSHQASQVTVFSWSFPGKASGK